MTTRTPPLLVIVAILAFAACGTSATSPPPAAAPALAPPSATAAPTPSGPTPTASPGLEARLDKMLATVDFNGTALLARDGETLYAKGIGFADQARNLPNSPQTRFRLASITKQFTAMAILILESRGELTAADRVCDYLATCPKGWAVITIEHLLDHTSGISEYVALPDVDLTTRVTPAQIVASVADIPLQGTLGETFSYTNTGYVLLGMIIEKVSGRSYERFLRDEILGPVGMDDTGYEHGDEGVAQGYKLGFVPADPLDMSIPYAAGALYSTVLDLQRWDAALYTEKLAPAAAMERYFTPLIESTGWGNFGYAYGWLAGEEDGHRLEQHAGGINGFATYIARYPDEHILVVVLSNRESAQGLNSFASTAARLARENP